MTDNPGLLIIPSIDIRSGKCVRLYQGDPDRQTVYSGTPADTARAFQDEGARRIHVVDLDGAFSGQVKNWKTLESIRSAVSVELELGGGIRTVEDLERLDRTGFGRFILGSVVKKDRGFFEEAVVRWGDRVVCGVDMKEGRLALKGWKDLVDVDLFGFLAELEKAGCKEIIYTDISRDGTLTGPNLEAVKAILDRTGLNVVISGGVGTYRDIDNIKNLKRDRVVGIILGKAIYEKKIELSRVIGP